MPQQSAFSTDGRAIFDSSKASRYFSRLYYWADSIPTHSHKDRMMYLVDDSMSAWFKKKKKEKKFDVARKKGLWEGEGERGRGQLSV